MVEERGMSSGLMLKVEERRYHGPTWAKIIVEEKAHARAVRVGIRALFADRPAAEAAAMRGPPRPPSPSQRRQHRGGARSWRARRQRVQAGARRRALAAHVGSPPRPPPPRPPSRRSSSSSSARSSSPPPPRRPLRATLEARWAPRSIADVLGER
ncbi:hypothetical protein EJB05_45744, partial [Eragrostis curvula]